MQQLISSFFKNLKYLLPVIMLVQACNTAEIPLDAVKKPALISGAPGDSTALDSAALANADSTEAPKLDFLKADSTGKEAKKKNKTK